MMPMVYDMAFYVVLRERFLLWHALRSALIIVYALGIYNIELDGLPAVGSAGRNMMILWGFGLSLALFGPFFRAYLEPGTISRSMANALNWSALYIIALTTIRSVPGVPDPLVKIALLGYLPYLGLLIASAYQALQRGSRAARFQSVGWAPEIAVALIMLFGVAFSYDVPDIFGTILLCAVAFEFSVTALGISQRFLEVRRERDAAKANAQLSQELAHTDTLTKISNRRALQAEFATAETDGRRVTAVALVDLDHFKRINDRHGHDVGDDVLRSVANSLESCEDAFAARMGGEEFALLIFSAEPEITAEGARQRITARVAADVEGLCFPVTASLGLARVVQSEPMREALRRADEFLYIAKREGRNRARWASLPKAAETGTVQVESKAA